MIERFDVNSDKWFEHVEILEQYFIANGIEDATKKKGILLTVIGNETYRLLRNLLSPRKPADKTFQKLIDTLSAHLNPNSLVIVERYKFYQRCQHTGESSQDYLAELPRMTAYCEFGVFFRRSDT